MKRKDGEAGLIMDCSVHVSSVCSIAKDERWGVKEARAQDVRCCKRGLASPYSSTLVNSMLRPT